VAPCPRVLESVSESDSLAHTSQNLTTRALQQQFLRKPFYVVTFAPFSMIEHVPLDCSLYPANRQHFILTATMQRRVPCPMQPIAITIAPHSC
jgi:hypothetical protein